MQFEDLMKMLLGKSKQVGEEGEQKPEKPSGASMPKLKRTSWRQSLDSDLHTELNSLVRKTHKHRGAYKKTLKVRDAQLWVALAQLSRRLGRIEACLGNGGDLEPEEEPETQTEESTEEEEQENTEQSTETQEAESFKPQFITSGQAASSDQPQPLPEQGE